MSLQTTLLTLLLLQPLRARMQLPIVRYYRAWYLPSLKLISGQLSVLTLDPSIVGSEHYRVTMAVQETLQEYSGFRTSLQFWWTKLSEGSSAYRCSRRKDSAVPLQVIPRCQEFTGSPGVYCTVERLSARFVLTVGVR